MAAMNTKLAMGTFKLVEAPDIKLNDMEVSMEGAGIEKRCKVIVEKLTE